MHLDIESIEQDEVDTTYHCRNSLFPFIVEVSYQEKYSEG